MARLTLDTNPKFKLLVHRLGLPRPYVRGLLETLWDVANACGEPVIGEADAVEAAAEWPGDPGELFAALRDTRLIDPVDEDLWEIHDYWDHAPEFARKRRKREQDRQLLGFSLDRNGLPRETVIAIFDRDPHECCLCGSTARIEIDHIVPRSAGGNDELDNLRLLCLKCNRAKAAEDKKAAAEFGQRNSSDRSLLDSAGKRPAVGGPRAPAPAHTLTPTSTPLSLDLPVETTPARDNGVGEVWQAYLAARDDYHQATSGRNYGAPALTEKRRKLIKRRLKEYPPDDLMAAVRGIFRSPHNRGNNDRGEEYLGIEIALRVNQDRNNVERFRDLWRRCSADERRGKRIETGALSPDGALRMGEDGQWEPVGGAPS